jgi:hypothetical protein
MNNSIFDLMDMFQTQFTFSNRVSSTSGKFATLLYIAFFMYLSALAVLEVMGRTKKNVFVQQTYDLNFVTDQNFYKKLHVLMSVGVYRTDNVLVSDPETILKEYLNMQISYISSNCFDYKTENFYNYKVGQNNFMVEYFRTYDINTLSDFFKVSMEKMPLKTEKQLAEFFKNYTIKIQVDYYFLKTQEKKIKRTHELIDILKSENKIYDEHNYFDYILKTKNQDYIMVNGKNYQSSANNIVYYFKPYILKLDPQIMFENYYDFYGFTQSEKLKNEYATSYASFEFRLSANKETYYFTFKKISASFAEIAGIMNVLKFIMYIFVVIITFIKRNQLFTDQLYDRDVIVSNYKVKSLNLAKKPFGENNTSKQQIINPADNDIKSDFSPVKNFIDNKNLNSGLRGRSNINNYVDNSKSQTAFRNPHFSNIMHLAEAEKGKF